MMVQLQQHAAQILAANKYMLTLGGDHLITLPLLRELAKKHGPVAIIHFDAHADAEKEPEQYHHGTLFFMPLMRASLLRIVPYKSVLAPSTSKRITCLRFLMQTG